MQATYVIGAGASAEIGMPIGNDLIKHIIAFLSNEPDVLRKYDLEQAAQFGIEAISIYFSRIKPGTLPKHHLQIMIDMLRALDYDLSIDNFLYTHQNNRAYQIIGEIAIFATILHAERASVLWTDLGSYDYISTLENTWYLSLFQQIIRQATLKDFIRRLDEIQFITFNYDRSLEFYLYHSLQRYYEVSKEQAAEIMNKAHIYHPYGQTGYLPYQQSPLTFDYGYFQEYTENDLSQYIKTYTEGTDLEAANYKTAITNLYLSDKVIFLGFAFHKQNIDLLYKNYRQFEDERRKMSPQIPLSSKYYATFYQISRENIEKSKNIMEYSHNRIRDFMVCEKNA
jgi:hypothetical protein